MCLTLSNSRSWWPWWETDADCESEPNYLLGCASRPRTCQHPHPCNQERKKINMWNLPKTKKLRKQETDETATQCLLKQNLPPCWLTNEHWVVNPMKGQYHQLECHEDWMDTHHLLIQPERPQEDTQYLMNDLWQETRVAISVKESKLIHVLSASETR